MSFNYLLRSLNLTSWLLLLTLGPGSSRRLQCTHTVRICKAYHMRAHVRRCTHSFLTLATPGTSACSSISAASSPDPDVRPHTTAAAIIIQTRCATSGHLYKYGCHARRREREQLISEKARGGASILGRAHEAEELPREPLTCRFVLVQPHLPFGSHVHNGHTCALPCSYKKAIIIIIMTWRIRI